MTGGYRREQTVGRPSGVEMRRRALLFIGVLLSCSVLASELPANATPPARTAGNYNLSYKFGQPDWATQPVTLNRNHTWTGLGENGTWSVAGKTVTLTTTFSGDMFTFVGTKNRVGISKRNRPGTLTDQYGDSGVWYAVRVPPC
jgi:hypothetical protein